MYKILTSTASADSAMKLREALTAVLGLKEKDIIVSKSSTKCQKDTVLLRYGCGYGELPKEPEWNSMKFINDFCINKYEFVKMMQPLVKVPEFDMENLPTEFPVIIRESLTKSKSEGVYVVHNSKEFLQHWQAGFWWTKFYKSDFELRVLVALSEKEYAVRIYKKEPANGVEKADDFIVEGENTVWRLKNPQYYPKVIKAVEKMLPTVWKNGGRFFAADMLYVPSEKDYVVLELNSGPWLTKGAAEWLAHRFAEYQWHKFTEKG